MNIIFQSGEFYGESNGFTAKLFGAIIGALISGLFAILVFILGTKREKNRIIENEKKRISELTEFLKTSLNLIQEKILNQYKYLIDFSHILKIRDFKDKSVQTSVALKIEAVRSIAHIDLYKIITAKNIENSNHYNEFQTNIEFLNTHKDCLSNLLNNFNDSFHKIQTDFSKSVTEFGAIYDKYSVNYEHELQPDLKELVYFWALQIKAWNAIDENAIKNYKTDPYIVSDNIIKPVIAFIRSRQIDSKFMEILTAANNCEFHLKNFDHARHMNRKMCLEIARDLIKIRNSMNGIIKNCL